MISRIIKKTVDLSKIQKVDQLEGPLYQLENGGHTFEITCLMDGTAASVSGTVSARFLRADEETVYFTGTLTGNVASITLPQSCYNVNGRFGLVVFVAGNDITSAVYAVAGSVYRSTSDHIIDPTEEIPSLEDLIAKIAECEEATAAAQQAASFVTSIVASAYSTSVVYTVGDYCTYEGALYRCTAETDGAFDPADWEAVKVGSEFQNVDGQIDDLKSALNAVEDSTGIRFMDFVDGAYIYTGGAIGSTLAIQETANALFSYSVATVSPGDTLHITGKGSGNAYLWTFVNSQNVILSKSASGATGDDLQIIAPVSAVKVVVNTLIANKGISYIGTYIKDAVSDIEKLIQTEKLITTADLVEQNSNFTITNGNITCDNIARPFNSLQIAANKIEFDYARVGTGHPLYIGVSINGHFVGNETRQVMTDVREIYDQSNILFAGATVDVSAGDTQYSSTPAHYTAEVNQNVFTLKREEVTIFKFTVANAYAIDGIAFLNYNFSEISNCVIIENYTLDGLNNLYKNVGIADIVGKDSKHYRIVAGVIRNSGSGWQFIIDENHQGDLNCVSVSSNASGQIVIDYSAITTKKVISFLVCPDEAFAFRGYICGSSVSRNQAYVEVYKYLPVSVYAEITCANDGTISIGDNSVGVSSATWDSTTNRLKIKHDAIGSTGCPVVIPAIYSSTIPRIYSSAYDSTTLQFLNIADGSLVTEVTDKMSFRFQRTSASGLKLVKQDANEIVASNGNFWFIGIFEV